jgi:outer membrane biosynthesis protein TonB
MDKQTANKKLKELRDSLSQVLDGKSYSSAEEIKEQSTEAIKSARKASSTLKKSFIEKIKDLPVVQKVSELGTAGSVAVSTAAVAQTTVAVDQTEVFVASVANDIVEERIEVPMFIDTFVDFHVLNNWGQVVIAEKMEAAQEFVDKVEAIAAPSSPSPSQSETPSGGDPKPSSSASSPDESQKSDGPSEQKQAEGKSEEQSKKEPKVEEKDSPEKTKNDSEKDKEDKQQQSQEQRTEDKQGSQEESSSESSTEPEDVKELPIVETPIDNDSFTRQISPTM